MPTNQIAKTVAGMPAALVSSARHAIRPNRQKDGKRQLAIAEGVAPDLTVNRQSMTTVIALHFFDRQFSFDKLERGGVDRAELAADSVRACQNLQQETTEIIGSL